MGWTADDYQGSWSIVDGNVRVKTGLFKSKTIYTGSAVDYKVSLGAVEVLMEDGEVRRYTDECNYEVVGHESPDFF